MAVELSLCQGMVIRHSSHSRCLILQCLQASTGPTAVSKKNTGENMHGINPFPLFCSPFPHNLSKCLLCIELGNVKGINKLQVVIWLGDLPYKNKQLVCCAGKYWFSFLLKYLVPFNTLKDKVMQENVELCSTWAIFPSLMVIVKWKAKTVYHNRKEKETKNHASRQFDLVLQPVGVGPFLPSSILPLLALGYSVYVSFQKHL